MLPRPKFMPMATVIRLGCDWPRTKAPTECCAQQAVEARAAAWRLHIVDAVHGEEHVPAPRTSSAGIALLLQPNGRMTFVQDMVSRGALRTALRSRYPAHARGLSVVCSIDGLDEVRALSRCRVTMVRISV